MQDQELLRVAPPNSADAERSVLGALLQDAGVATVVFETLMPDDFYTAEHREIFDAMRTLHIGGSPIDVMTVSNELTRRGTLEGVGGTAERFVQCIGIAGQRGGLVHARWRNGGRRIPALKWRYCAVTMLG